MPCNGLRAWYGVDGWVGGTGRNAVNNVDRQGVSAGAGGRAVKDVKTDGGVIATHSIGGGCESQLSSSDISGTDGLIERHIDPS